MNEKSDDKTIERSGLVSPVRRRVVVRNMWVTKDEYGTVRMFKNEPKDIDVDGNFYDDMDHGYILLGNDCLQIGKGPREVKVTIELYRKRRRDA